MESVTSVAADESEDENGEEEDVEEANEFTVKKQFKNKSSTVLIELPKDILNNPEIVGMLDRTGTTSRKL